MGLFSFQPARLFFIKPAGFGTVAAITHVAPTPAAVTAGIEKKPATGWVTTLFDPL